MNKFPSIIYPELATLVDEPPDGDIWIHEIKFDGYRLIAFKQKKTVRLMTRNQNDWTKPFAIIADAIKKLFAKDLILDGEVVVLDEDHHSNFQLLQNSIKEGQKPFIYYVFDLIFYDKKDLSATTLLERKKILRSLIPEKSKVIRYSDHVQGSGKKIFKNTCRLGLEGIVSKDLLSTYVQGRTKAWLKAKCTKRQEFVIGGYLLPDKTTRKHFRSLMLGTYNKQHQLIYHGNVGTGFTESTLKEIKLLLDKYKSKKMLFTKTPPGSKNAIWLKPVLVAEVEFTEWTNDGTLRHPSFKGIRMDKPAKTIIKESSAKLTHPDKILYKEDKITKLDIANYYEYIADWILPYISDRPLSLVRCPDTYKDCFFQKHMHQSHALSDVTIKTKNGKKEKYLYLNDIHALMELAQISALEIHPWNCTISNLECPDIIIFDLDPAPDTSWKKVVAAAKQIKQYLTDFKLQSFVKTTGGKGLHIVIPIKPKYHWDEIKNFSHVFVNTLAMKHPENYVSKMTKSLRKGKIFVDYLRNQQGATSIAAYSTRARLHAPVSTPLAWNELTDNYKDTYFTIKTLPERLDKIKDPWKDFFEVHQSLDLNARSG